jgi:predicted aspartyl protease
VELVVDTGFAGELLVPYHLFESAGLLPLITAERFKAVMADRREIPLITALGLFDVGGERLRTRVHTSRQLDKKVAGRGFLRAFVATLDGVKEELSLRKG